MTVSCVFSHTERPRPRRVGLKTWSPQSCACTPCRSDGEGFSDYPCHIQGLVQPQLFSFRFFFLVLHESVETRNDLSGSSERNRDNKDPLFLNTFLKIGVGSLPSFRDSRGKRRENGDYLSKAYLTWNTAHNKLLAYTHSEGVCYTFENVCISYT